MDPETVNNPQPEPIIASVPPISQPKSKLPIILGGIILLVAVGTLGVLTGKYLFGSKTPETAKPIATVTTIPTPTIDPTTDWKTYTNDKYGYEIKYPEDWINQGLNETISVAQVNFSSGEGLKPFVSVIVRKDQNEARNDYKALFSSKIGEKIKKSYGNFVKIENSILAGYPAVIFSIEFLAEGESPEIYFDSPRDLFIDKGNRIYEISLAIPFGFAEKEKYLTIFDQILSTFKLINAQIDTNTPGKENNFSGLLRKTTSRPAPDIAYDYEIILDQPLTGITTGAGDNQTLTKIIATGTNINLENYVGKHINFTASLGWGYAESKVFSITKIIESN